MTGTTHAVILSIVIGLVSLLSIASPRAQDGDRQSCNPGSGTTYLIVDTTTKFTDDDRLVLKEGVERLVERLAIGQRLRVVRLADSMATMRLVFDECRPGCDGSMVTCAQLREKIRTRSFFTRLDDAITGIAPKEDLHRSDVAVTLTYAVRWQSEERAGPRSLIVFSDMLEHSSLLDLRDVAETVGSGREKAETAIARGIRRLESGGFHPDLQGVDVQIFGFGREHARHAPLDPMAIEFLRRFWTEALLKAGARSVELRSYLP